MPSKPLYTIGHGSRKIEDFIDLLKRYRINYLVDVRTYPRSRFHPQFNRKALEQSLIQAGITYVFMGDLLGGRPTDAGCYVDGRIDYKAVQAKDFYKQGINRLKTAYAKELALAIMCSERAPGDCHRSRLIGETLAAEEIELLHINEFGKLTEHTAVMNALKKPQPLF